VVNSRIIASCALTITRINVEEKNTVKPREILETEAIAIGRVLNGLKANPIAGKNTGADWNSTATVVNMPPIQINLPIFIFFNLNASYLVLLLFRILINARIFLYV
jgi:hypothetical protein